MKIKFSINLFALILIVAFYSCETEFVPEGTELETEIVVEGYIEAGEDATPPFLFLTKSVSFFNEFNSSTIEDLFVHDAEVKVFDGTTEHTLNEFCLDEIPAALRPAIVEALGFDPDSLDINLCVYLDLTGQLEGTIGGQYDLSILLEDGRTLTSTTTIPPHIPLNDLWFIKPAEEAPDSLLELRGVITDFVDRQDYYRYFVATNDGAFRAPFQSVADDAFFDGSEFEIPIPNSQGVQDESFETFGLYQIGDTTRIKWTNIDRVHFDFWSTLEFNAVSQGPFSSYTQVSTNIDGGLGIWGGYSISQYQIVVKE